uniref:Uncharacterized protein n=1 Tax=Zea mays TaxID=4577 RepID=B7ZZK9_MAIZE|nr:unknown [Zea mays]
MQSRAVTRDEPIRFTGRDRGCSPGSPGRRSTPEWHEVSHRPSTMAREGDGACAQRTGTTGGVPGLRLKRGAELAAGRHAQRMRRGRDDQERGAGGRAHWRSRARALSGELQYRGTTSWKRERTRGEAGGQIRPLPGEHADEAWWRSTGRGSRKKRHGRAER